MFFFSIISLLTITFHAVDCVVGTLLPFNYSPAYSCLLTFHAVDCVVGTLLPFSSPARHFTTGSKYRASERVSLHYLSQINI